MCTEEDVRTIIRVCFEEYCDAQLRLPCGCDACDYGKYEDCFDEYERRKMLLIPLRREEVK